MQPVFPSGSFEDKPAHMRWFIPKDKTHLDKPLLLAGRPIGLNTHRVGRRTWPCLYNWPKLGRECPHCDRSRRWTTWVPVVPLDNSNRQMVLMGGETTWKSVKDLERGSIVVTRMALMLKPTLMFFKHALQTGAASMRMATEYNDIGKGDITRWLLHYWQWTDLTKWWGESFRESIKSRGLREKAEADPNYKGLPMSFSQPA